MDDFIILRARRFTSYVRHKLTHNVLNDEDLTVLEWQLLFSIARFGSCHVGYVTNHTSIDPAHGSRAATSLEKKGLISRVEDPDNRRRKLVSLTASGVKAFERIWPKARQITADKTNLLTKAELAELKRLLDVVNGISSQDLALNSAPGQRAAPEKTKEEYAAHSQ
ncbi:MAG: MarR family winged helix-turn-helix transcriptional regulator [Sulfitobacter sp.]